MSRVVSVVKALERKGYLVDSDNQGSTVTILAQAPDGEPEMYFGNLRGLIPWANKLPSHQVEEPTSEPPPQEWDEQYADELAALEAAEAAGVALPEMVPQPPPEVILLPAAEGKGETTVVKGLTDAAVRFAEQLRQRRAAMAPERVPTPTVESAPRNIRGTLTEAWKSRRYVFVEYVDRFGARTSRALLPYAVTKTYCIAFCDMRFNEVHARYRAQFRETWNEQKGYGWAGNRKCSDWSQVRAAAQAEAVRRFFVDKVQSAQPLDKEAPLPKEPENIWVPISDQAAKRGKPIYTRDGTNLENSGHWVRYSDILGLAQDA